jgi:hypothetical protein
MESVNNEHSTVTHSPPAVHPASAQPSIIGPESTVLTSNQAETLSSNDRHESDADDADDELFEDMANYLEMPDAIAAHADLKDKLREVRCIPGLFFTHTVVLKASR